MILYFTKLFQIANAKTNYITPKILCKCLKEQHLVDIEEMNLIFLKECFPENSLLLIPVVIILLKVFEN